MATFEFGSQGPNRPKMVSGRELLARKAAQQEAARIAAEAAAQPKPPAPAAPASNRKPRIPNALFADGKVNLPVRKAATPTALPSSVMDQSVQAGASRLPENEIERGADDAPDAVAPEPVATPEPAAAAPIEPAPAPGVPPPGAPKTSGFSFKGAATSAEDFAQLGLVAPPGTRDGQAIPPHMPTPDESFFYQDAPPPDDVPMFDEAGAPIMPQRGANRQAGPRMIAGIPATTFEGWEPNVPPGSHYDEWVWNAMDKPGHVTIELYVDARHLGNSEKRTSVLEQAYQTKAPSARAKPKFDPGYHVLISIEQPKQAPWLDATRVLLTPETIKPVPIRKDNRAKMDFGGGGAPQAEKKDPAPSWESEPSGITSWLNRDPHHNVIFGRVLLDALTRRGGDMYWMVLSHADAMRIHKQVYGTGQSESLDSEHKFGREGLFPMSSTYDEESRKRTNAVVPAHERHPVPPAKRYLGHWSGPSAQQAIALAQQGAGPQLDSWPAEDVQFVLQSHAGIQAKQKAQAKTQESVVITPRATPAVKLPPGKPKADAPVNKMRMRTF